MLEEVWYNNNGTRVKAYEYEYTADGLVSSVKDNINSDRTEYTYDHRNRAVRIATTRDSDMHNSLFTYREFQDDGKLRYTQTWVDVLSDTNYDDDYVSYLRQYNNDAGNLYNYVIICRNTSFGLGFTYDEFERVSLLSFSMKSFDADYTYTYKSNGEYTTGLIDSVTTVINETTTKSESYTYDAEGNITKITYSDGKVIQYGYDNLGQLISENNGVTGTSGTYTYDDAGNLVETTIGGVTNTYSYTDSDWGDLLTSFNGVQITYDEIGNPLSYYNGSNYTFTWQGRRLMTAIKGTKNMSFAYDEEGVRISKTVNGVTTNYYYQGTMLYAEETNSEIIVYFYDQNGAPVGFQYRGADYARGVWDFYAYEKNIFGDIVAVYDESGTKLVSYTYNAWGECTVTNHTTVPTVVANNAYRYRGYYYDSDLDMYYLQSRYYDANICRFINVDGLISGVSTTLQGYNLYVYCFNNPIAYTDSNGDWPKWAENIGNAIVDAAKAVVNFFSQNAHTVNGQFQDGIFRGSGSLTGGYSDIMARAQGDKKLLPSSKDPSVIIGGFTKLSILNATGKVGIGNNNVVMSVKGVGDVLTASAQAGLKYQDGLELTAKAKAAVVSGRATLELSVFGWQVEFGVTGDALSVGAEATIGIFDGAFEAKANASLGVGCGFVFRIKPTQ